MVAQTTVGLGRRSTSSQCVHGHGQTMLYLRLRRLRPPSGRM